MLLSESDVSSRRALNRFDSSRSNALRTSGSDSFSVLNLHLSLGGLLFARRDKRKVDEMRNNSLRNHSESFTIQVESTTGNKPVMALKKKNEDKFFL